MERNVKSHGMSPQKASRVKKRGHLKEEMFARYIDGEVIKGTKKQDVQDKYGKMFSLKGGSEIKNKEGRDGKWQIFLLSKSRFENDVEFPGREIFLDILNCYPTKYEDYESDKKKYKEMIIPHMIRLKEFLINVNNKLAFFDKAFFDKKVDYFVIHDDDVFHIFDKKEAWGVFMYNFKVENSSTFQKVVFKDKTLNGEIEVRSTNDGKYPSILFCMRKRINADLLMRKITEYKDFTPVLRVYGKARDTFKL